MCRFVAIFDPPFPIIAGGPIQWGRITVTDLGDVNGDGFDDIAIGAKKAGSYAGATYVVFGTDQGFAASINLESLGSAGFKVTGTATDEKAGSSVASADINGDGLDDIIIGSEQNSSNGSGKTIVIYGSTSLGSNITTAAADTVINGIDIGDRMGGSVSNTGDINGDGIDDIVIGAQRAGPSNTGEAYVLFGKAGGLGSTVNTADLATGGGSDGFLVTSSTTEQRMGSVSNLGDINGDGYDDVVIGAYAAGGYSGAAYVIYGKNTGFDQVIDVDTLAGGDGSAGFRIQGLAGGAFVGQSVTSAGDINGDGLDDILFDAANVNSSTGETYVIFGSNRGFGADFSLATMSADQGFKLSGESTGDKFGSSVSSAGDINGDGFDDLMVGASNVFVSGSSYGSDGSTYIIYGQDFFSDKHDAASSGNDRLVGTSGVDIIDGQGGADVINAGAGNDRVTISDSNFKEIDGGGGQDTVILDGAFNLDITALTNGALTRFEHFDMDNGLANTLDLDFGSVIDIGEAIDQILGEADALVISGDTNDTVNLNGNWTERASQPEEASTAGYTVYDSDDSSATVAIQNSINTNLT